MATNQNPTPPASGNPSGSNQQQSLNPTPLQPGVVGDKTQRKLKLGKQQLGVLFVVAFILVAGGFYFVQSGFLSASAPADSLAVAQPEMGVVTPRNKPMDAVNKYGNVGPNVSPTSSLNPTDQAADENTLMLTGEPRKWSLGTNESLSDRDLREVSSTQPAGGGAANPYQQKQQISSRVNSDISRMGAEQRSVVRNLQDARRQELLDQQREAEKQAYDRRTQERILANMESNSRAAQEYYQNPNRYAMAVSNQGGVPAGAQQPVGQGQPGGLAQSGTPGLKMEEFYRVKAYYKGQIPAQLAQYYSKEMAEEQRLALAGDNTGIVLTQVIQRQSNGQQLGQNVSRRNGFYGLNGKRQSPTGSGPSQKNLAIPAVIHGDADVIKVTNGSTVKIRLTEGATLMLNGDQVELPANGLLSGVCSIAGERVQITISNLRIGNYLYQAAMQVYDMDGIAGVRVPDLNTKQAASQMLVQTGTSASQMPYFVNSSGNVGQQFANQMAYQMGNQLFQGARNLAGAKLGQPIALIRANYMILLKGGANSNMSDPTMRGNRVEDTSQY